MYNLLFFCLQIKFNNKPANNSFIYSNLQKEVKKLFSNNNKKLSFNYSNLHFFRCLLNSALLLELKSQEEHLYLE